MTRLLIAAMLAALIGVPAQAQTDAAPDGDGAAQTAPAAAGADDDDDDDDDDDAPAAAASTVSSSNPCGSWVTIIPVCPRSRS